MALAVSMILGLSTAHAADPVITDPTSTTIGAFTGGDPGEGLDLSGEFIYGIAAGAEADLEVKIGDATFKGTVVGDEIPGVTLEAGNRNPNWYVVTYGDSQADIDLATATSSIRWSAAGAAIPAVSVTLENLQVGVRYKFQMMFGEECCNRGFDILFDDALVVKDPAQVFLPRANVSTVYIFAKSDRFFVYPNNYNHFVTYYRHTFQHGGISLEEMLVPWAVLKPR